MTRYEVLRFIHDYRVTSLGKFAHGYVIYQQTANQVVNRVFDYFEQRITELEAKTEDLETTKTCDGCKYDRCNTRTRVEHCYSCSRYVNDNYEAKDKQ